MPPTKAFWDDALNVVMGSVMATNPIMAAVWMWQHTVGQQNPPPTLQEWIGDYIDPPQDIESIFVDSEFWG